MEQQRPDDRSTAVSVGEEFGLGEARTITLARAYPPATGLGITVAGLSVYGILPAMLTAGWAQTANAAAFGTLFLAGCLLFCRGVAGAKVTGRLQVYSGGLAEFSGDEPAPQVVRWADAEAITVTYVAAEAASGPVLTGCLVRARDGTELPTARLRYETTVLRAVAAEVGRALAPRLAAPLIEAYESGERVTVGGTRIDAAGITVELPGGTLIPWGDIDSIAINDTPAPDRPGVVSDIAIAHRSARLSWVIRLSGVPNGVFLPHLVARAATAHGVPVGRRLRGPAESGHTAQRRAG